jgi:TonB family protein
MLVFAVLSLLLGAPALAQEGHTPPEDRDDDLTRLLFPSFPEAVRSQGARGYVVVEIIVAANGEVADARATSGDERLRALVEDAARKWVFEPPRDFRARRPRPRIVWFDPKGQVVVYRKPRGSYVAWPETELTLERGSILGSTGGEGDVKRTPVAATCRVQPDYPRMAKDAKVEGSVVIETLLGEDGRVKSAHALSGHPLLRRAAERAALLWEFEAYLVEGTAIEVHGTLTFNFYLGPRR